MAIHSQGERALRFKRRHIGAVRKREIKYGLLFASPAVLFFSLFYLYPLGRAIYISFHKWSLLSMPRFIGTRNYQRLLHDPEFFNSLKVTFYYTFATVIPIWSSLLAFGFISQAGSPPSILARYPATGSAGPDSRGF